jgi:hypothetical protein
MYEIATVIIITWRSGMSVNIFKSLLIICNMTVEFRGVEVKGREQRGKE